MRKYSNFQLPNCIELVTNRLHIKKIHFTVETSNFKLKCVFEWDSRAYGVGY